MSEMEQKKEKGKKKVKEEEEEMILDHFSHQHPLTLTESDIDEYLRCDGCTRYIVSGETVYKCRHKCRFTALHEECAEMPLEIRLSMHPQHTLIQRQMPYVRECAVCESDIHMIGYYCSSPDSCGFKIHVGCALDTGVLKSCIDHPSHSHQLTLLWRPGRSCLSRCDACGTIERGNSYICIDCQYWIHKSCADLPAISDYRHLHHHPLSLAFHVPLEYIKLRFACDICFKEFLPKYWVYHCTICRYVVHIKCAIKSSPANTNNIVTDAAGDKDVIVFPVNNAVEELIGPFVTKVGGAKAIPRDNKKYKFHNHDHELSLISCPFHDEEERKEEDSDEDDDDLNLRKKSEVICDGCTTPIYQRRHHSSSKCYNYYLSCGECKYFLHWECFHLPHDLPSHPLHQIDGHNLILQTPPKFDTIYCSICRVYTNGFIYKCTVCSFKVDIKCACLPDTLKHAAHPHHHLKHLSAQITGERYWNRMCGACRYLIFSSTVYKCGICEFILHSYCASLPAAVTNPAWDRHHPLPLTFDATVNHPGGFYCDVCEDEMHPKRWMYHCRSCDISFHPDCFPTASGIYRNIKFGQRNLVAAVHPHPLVYQLLTKKLRCDVCWERKEYGCFGFQCDSDKCDFFVCLRPCARKYLDASLFHNSEFDDSQEFDDSDDSQEFDDFDDSQEFDDF